MHKSFFISVFNVDIVWYLIVVKTRLIAFTCSSRPVSVKVADAHRNNYSLAVGDDADISTHTDCGSAPTAGATETDAKYVVPCRAVGRYLSIKRSGTEDLRYMALCEVIVMGYVYNGDDSTGVAHSTNFFSLFASFVICCMQVNEVD